MLAPGQEKKEKPPLHAYGEKVTVTDLVTHLGISTLNHSGIHSLVDGVVLAATGDLVLFIDYKDGTVESMSGPADGGIGAVCVHPSRSRFVVCEKSFNGPNVVVYDYPTKRQTHVMKNGALYGYSAVSFNPDGRLLATVGTEPDYVITVWNWEQQSIVLRNKAFGSDVFSVAFSPFSDSMLVTSGLGHLKVWDMASTFTGLKLQGTVGKFGKVEISDISGYAILPDGKVVSGSEFGTLLLWEGELVKCELMRIDDTAGGNTNNTAAEVIGGFSAGNNSTNSTADSSDNNNNTNNNTTNSADNNNNNNNNNNNANPLSADPDMDLDATTTLVVPAGYIPKVNGRQLLKCHEGNIEVVKLVEDNKLIMTAGNDGYVRYWSFAEIDVCEPNGLTHIVGIKMVRELFLGEGVKAKSAALSVDRSHWVLLDAGGSIRTFPRWPYTYITGPKDAPPPEPSAASSDAAPSAYAIAAAKAPSGPLIEFFDGHITALVASPTDRSTVVGGADGTIRLYDTIGKTELYRATFDAGVMKIAFLPKSVDPSGLLFYAGFTNGAVRFLRKCRDGFELVASVRPHETAAMVSLALSADCTQLYTAAADGSAFYCRVSVAAPPSPSSRLPPTIEIEPFGYCYLPDKAVPTTTEWAAEGDVCFFGFSSGMLLAVAPPAEKPNHAETFEFPIRYAGVGYRQRKNPPKKVKKVSANPNDHDESSSDEEDEDEDQGPWAITAIQRLPPGVTYSLLTSKEAAAAAAKAAKAAAAAAAAAKASASLGDSNDDFASFEEEVDTTPTEGTCGYVVILEKEELAYTYNLSIRYADKLGPPPIPPTGVDPPGRVEEPGPNVAYRDAVPIKVAVSQDEKTLLMAFNRGEVTMRRLNALGDCNAPVPHARQLHDSVGGKVTGMALLHDESALVTVGTDGLIVTQRLESGPFSPFSPATITAGTQSVALGALPIADPSKRLGGPSALATPATRAEDAKKAAIAHSVEKQRRIEDEAAAEALAEGKRSYIKKKIAAVHKEYVALLEENDAAVGGRKLSEAELVLDPELARLLELEKVNRVEEASVEFSWQAAYKEQLLKQLRGAFVDTMTYDRFLVHSFDKTFSVASIRTPAFTPEQKEKLEQLQKAIAAGTNNNDNGGNGKANESGSGGGNNSAGGALVPTTRKQRVVITRDAQGNEVETLVDAEGNEDDDDDGCDSHYGSDGEGGRRAMNHSPTGEGDDGDMGPANDAANNTINNATANNDNNATSGTFNSTAASINDTFGKNKALKSQLEKAEERKRERLERKRGLEDLLSRKPKPTDVDPTLEGEMKFAREHMGDHVLKTSPDYRVPASLLPTADRKAKQLILLEHSINNLRAAFNEKLLSLRDMKKNICVELNQDRQRLAEIIAILNLDPSELPPAFELMPLEQPEQRFEVTPTQLRRWAKERAKAQKKFEAQQRAGRGFGADLNGGDDEQLESESDGGEDSGREGAEIGAAGGGGWRRLSRRISGGHRESAFARKPSLLSLKEKLELDLKARLESVRMGELEEEEAMIQRETLMYEKGRLIRRMEAAKKSYDEKLLEFFQERMRLEADICMADMRALLLYREFGMLLNFQKRDRELEEVLATRLAEQSRIHARIKAISHDIQSNTDRQLGVERGFAANRHNAEMHIKTAFPLQDQPYLLEVFNRKIKRVKAIEDTADDDDAPTSSEDEEEDLTGDNFVEAKPPTCDEAAWQQLLQLREGRLDLEDAQSSLAQKAKEFEKILRGVKDKERSKVEKELAESRNAIDAFQLEKQRQLNLLETIVVLKLSQIQCLDEQRRVPHNLQKAPVIVFTETAINRLRARIAELAEEKHDLARRAEQLARAKQALLRRKSKRQLEHGEWEQRVAEVMLLKFGQKVDLEALENLAVDRETEELKQHLKMEEIKWERELRKQEGRVQTLRYESQVRIADNTLLLKDLGNVREEQQTLEHALTASSHKIVGKMAGGSKVATAADRAQLKDLVVRQQQELDMLGNEISMLKHKGGHVYTPVIQRLQEQEREQLYSQQQQAFASSTPIVGVGGGPSPPASGNSGGAAAAGLNNTYSGGGGGAYPTGAHPSSAPSSQQQQQKSSGGGGGLDGGASSLVVRPTGHGNNAAHSSASASARAHPAAAGRGGIVAAAKRNKAAAAAAAGGGASSAPVSDGDRSNNSPTTDTEKDKSEAPP